MNFIVGRIKGITFHIDKSKIFDYKEGDYLIFKKDPLNVFDCNAIAVFDCENNQIGFVSKEINKNLWNIMSDSQFYIVVSHVYYDVNCPSIEYKFIYKDKNLDPKFDSEFSTYKSIIKKSNSTEKNVDDLIFGDIKTPKKLISLQKFQPGHPFTNDSVTFESVSEFEDALWQGAYFDCLTGNIDSIIGSSVLIIFDEKFEQGFRIFSNNDDEIDQTIQKNTSNSYSINKIYANSPSLFALFLLKYSIENNEFVVRMTTINLKKTIFNGTIGEGIRTFSTINRRQTNWENTTYELTEHNNEALKSLIKEFVKRYK